MRDFPNLGKIQSSRLVRKSPFSARKHRVRLGVAWVLLFCVAGFFVTQRIEYLRTERRIRGLMAEIRQLQGDILPLKLEESYLTRTARIEALAKQIGLRPVSEWQKFYLAPPQGPEEGGEPESQNPTKPPEQN